MKTLLKIAASLLMLAGIHPIFAQNCTAYYPPKQGAVREMTNYDKNNKMTGTSVQTIKEIKTEGSKTEWTIGTVSKDDKGKELSSGDLHMSCEGGIFKMDMKNFIDQKTLQSFQGMNITMDATDLEFPSSLAVGQTLKDGSITITISNQGMTMMTMIIKIYDRKVVAVEDVTTPAGKFSCYKMTETVETKSMMSIIAKTTDWMAKDVGTVRTENYDKDGKLMGSSVLTSLK